MAEINKRIDLNRPETQGEKTLKSIGVRGLVASDLPASEVISTLSKRVRRAKTQTEKYSYVASKIFGKNLEFDGLIDVNYTELQTTDSTNPYDDVKLADFNGETNKSIRFTYEAKTQSNVKTKMLNDTIMNFKTVPGDAITAIYKGTANINKTQELVWCGQVWTEMKDRFAVVGLPAGTKDVASEGESVSKSIYETLTNYGTTHKEHLGVGTDLSKPGIIEDGKGNEVKPSLNFDSSEFYLVMAPGFKTNTVMDGEKVYFNWNGGNLPLAGVETLDFAKAEEIPADVKSELTGTRALLVHKNAIAGVQDWEGSGVANAGKLYTVFHNYMKQDAYPLYDAPIVKFDLLA